MKNLKCVFACLALSLSSLCFAADPVQNFIDTPVAVKLDGSTPTIEEIKIAIINSCRKRGWTPVVGGANVVNASLLVRGKHYAEIEITYTNKTYSIKYKSSRELDYDDKKQTIHRNYNKWVVMLSSSIQREFGVGSEGV